MSDLDLFIDNVKAGILSDHAPVKCMKDGRYGFEREGDFLSSFQARDTLCKMGMWAVVDKQWTKELATWINGRKCLEVMAGAGWLAKALRFYGVDIIATDDFSWRDGPHKAMNVVSPVEEIGGMDAIKKYYDRDILMVSWPPYEEEEICRICDEWGNDKPIVYIGESDGCCASSSFFKNFKEDGNDLNILIPQWFGMHDYLCVGYWNKVEDKKVEQLEVEEVEA